MATILTVEGRGALIERREPYWSKLGRGKYVGYRKMPKAKGSAKGVAGTWIARFREESTGKQHYRSLGDLSNCVPARRYDAAKAEAEAWFKHLGRGGSLDSVTVREACERYVAHVKGESGDKASRDAEARFSRWVYADAKFAGTELRKLSKSILSDWRRNLQSSPVVIGAGESVRTRDRTESAVNRDMTSLRAALNHAKSDGLVTSDIAWKLALKPIKNADRRRDLYLDKSERRSLLKHCSPALESFLRALCLVPIRPGAMAALKARDYDVRLKTLSIGVDKAGGERRISLPDQTAAFFATLRKSKLPDAPLIANGTGGHWNKDGWKYPIKSAAERAGLPLALTAYTLRHSVITDLVTSGLDAMTVAQLSGTSVAMIEKHYAHLRKEHAKRALARLEVF